MESEYPRKLSFEWEGNTLIRSSSLEYCNFDDTYESYNEAEYDSDGRLISASLAYAYTPSTGERKFLPTSNIEYLDIDEHGNWKRRVISINDENGDEMNRWIETREIIYY